MHIYIYLFRERCGGKGAGGGTLKSVGHRESLGGGDVLNEICIL